MMIFTLYWLLDPRAPHAFIHRPIYVQRAITPLINMEFPGSGALTLMEREAFDLHTEGANSGS